MNETLSDRIAFFEGVEFDIQVNILSGLNSFVNALEEHERVRQLIELIETSSAAAEIITSRIATLVEEGRATPEYLNAHDCAITAYIYTLEQTSFALTDESLVALAANDTLFWARRLAARFAQTRQAQAIPEA